MQCYGQMLQGYGAFINLYERLQSSSIFIGYYAALTLTKPNKD